MRHELSRLLFLVTLLLGLSVQGRLWAAEPDCSKVIHVATDSPEAKGIKRCLESYVNKYQKEKSKLEFRTIEKVGKWLVVEADFTNLEPGIFVLEQTKKSYRVTTEFGGYVEEKPEKAIRSYFLEKAPDAPKELYQCYNPKGIPFHREGE